MPVVNEILSPLNIDDDIKKLVIFAVASHHTTLHQELYAQADPNQVLDVQNKKHFEDIIEGLENQIGLRHTNINTCYNNPCSAILDLARNDFLPASDAEGIMRREQFVIIEGILNNADWLASGQQPLPQPTFQPFQYQPYPYQTRARTIQGSIFITLPTGTGKTETALYWVIANMAGQSRTFYTLPTTVTINSMYHRLSEPNNYGLSRDLVGEYYSNVDLFLELEGQHPTKGSLNLYKNFFYPINVTTPDQIILAMMNHGRFPLKSFSFRNSLIILDEIHAYDPTTFGLIVGMIRHLHNHYGAKFCILSATFPNILKRELNFLGATELLNQQETRDQYLQIRRTRWEFSDDNISAHIDDIITAYRSDKKVLVVVNKVRTAQAIFQVLRQELQDRNLPTDDIMLIHSRFIFSDRRALERRIMTYPKIVVSTQIIEVSLDIDYDIMFTEACFLDSLVQRTGRINRRGHLGNHGEGLVRIFLPEGWNDDRRVACFPYDRNMLERAVDIIRQESPNITTEWDYVRLTNEFYDNNWQRDPTAEDRFAEVWNTLGYIYRANLSEDRIRQLLQTRFGSVITVNAYSRTHWPTIQAIDQQVEATTDENARLRLFRQIRMYSLSIPITIRANFTTEQGVGDREYLIVERAYDPVLGL